MAAKPELKATLQFRTAAALRKWFAANHGKSEGIWLRISKKDSGIASVSYAEALDEALCFGWIDGQKQRGDETCWLQKMTPRRKKSGWSKINTQHAKRLIKAGRMHAAGHAAIEAAKRDGRWKAAYDSPSKATMPEDFLTVLRGNEKAAEFFETLSKVNRYSISYRLQSATKPELREKRMKMILGMLERGETFH